MRLAPKTLLVCSALSGCSCVILGAFGAHGLKTVLPEELLSAFETAVNYQFMHTLALMGLAVLLTQRSTLPRALTAAGWLWIIGIFLFSGSLYGLVLGGPSWLGPLTPLGGLTFISGWIALAIGSYQLSL